LKDNFRKEFKKIIFCNKKTISKNLTVTELTNLKNINQPTMKITFNSKNLSKSVDNNINAIKILYDDEVRSLKTNI
jgi:predicted lipoprotein